MTLHMESSDGQYQNQADYFFAANDGEALCMLSRSVVSDSFATLWTVAPQAFLLQQVSSVVVARRV